jgi:hypothetical protein
LRQVFLFLRRPATENPPTLAGGFYFPFNVLA